jgi:hypothetical protein
MKRFRLFFSFAFLLAAFFSAHAQNQPGEHWARINDDKIDILIPPHYLVDNEIEKSFILAPVRASLPEVIDLFEKPRITGHLKSVRVNLSVYQLRQVPAAKNFLWYFAGRDNAQNTSQKIESGDFSGRIDFLDTEKTLRTRVVVAVKSRVYVIDVYGKKEDRQIYERILGSLSFGGQTLFKLQPNASPVSAKPVSISDLRTSPEILQALIQKQDKSEIKIDKENLNLYVDTDDERDFSRPLVILRQPLTIFSPETKAEEKTGTIKLKITFLASGKIGGVTAYSDLPEEMVDQTLKSVRKIKFLPAEIDGKKVDSAYTVRYVFQGR